MFVFFTLDVSGCDVNLTVTDTKQYFATEGYPFKYKHNQDCHFNFEAPPGRRISVFFEEFHLEDKYDFLHFRKLHNFKKRHWSLQHTKIPPYTHIHTYLKKIISND